MQVVAGRVTVTGVPVPLVLLVGTVNFLREIVAATYSAFQGRDNNVNAAYPHLLYSGVFVVGEWMSVRSMTSTRRL